MHFSCSSHSSVHLPSQLPAEHGKTKSDSVSQHADTSSQSDHQRGFQQSKTTSSLFYMTYAQVSSQVKTVNAQSSITTTTTSVHSSIKTGTASNVVNFRPANQKVCNHAATNTSESASTLKTLEKFFSLLKTLLSLVSGMNRNSGASGNANQSLACNDQRNEMKTCVETPEPASCNQVVATKDGARIWGDPHFVGADGGKYDIHGEPGKIYNILSDQGIQVNAKFDNKGAKDGATYLYETGFTLNGNQVYFDKSGQLEINGQEVGDGSYLGGAVVKEGNKLTVTTPEYEIGVDAKGNRLDMELSSKNVNADGVMPHGLWGQTADGDGIARNGDKGKSAQGGGAIEGLNGMTEKGNKTAYKHYETNGLFDTGFSRFNRYH